MKPLTEWYHSVLHLVKEKLKEWYSRISRRTITAIVLLFIFVPLLPYVDFLMAGCDRWEKRNIKHSHQLSILHEINTARDKLDLILCYSHQKTKTEANISLDHKIYVLESFADNLTIKNDLFDLYDALYSAQIRAKELMDLMDSKNPNPTTMQNREADIKTAIDFADKIGLQVAKEIGGRWKIPSPKMSEVDRIKYYLDKIRPSIATAPLETRSK